MFVLVILPTRLALVMLAPARKRRIGEELADSPKRYRQSLVRETSWVSENVAAKVTVLSPKLIFISELLSILESRTCPDAQARARASIVYILAVCR